MFDWLIYPALIAAVTVLYGLIGLPYAALLARYSKVLLCLAPIFGLSVLAIAGSWYSLLERPMSLQALLLVVALSGVTGVVILYRQYRRSDPASPGRPFRSAAASAAQLIGSCTAPWVVALVAITIFITPIVTMPILHGGFLTSFTSMNNDLASYILQATNLQQAGFGPTDFLVDPDFPQIGSLGDLARYDHTGASSLLASTALAFGIPVWKIASIAVLAAAACALPATYVMAHEVLRLRLRWCLVASAAGTLTVYLWYVTAQAFYAQIIAALLMAVQIAFFFRASRTGKFWPCVALSPVLLAAGWFTAPEVQLISSALLGIAVGLGLFQRRGAQALSGFANFAREYLRMLVFVAVAALFSLVLAIPRIKGAVEVLSSVGKDGVSGWKLNVFPSASVLLGFDGRSNPVNVSDHLGVFTGADALAWLILVCLLAGLIALAWVRRDGRTIPAFVMLGVLSLLSGVGIYLWGVDGYQTWKLIMTVSFIFLTLVAGIWLRVVRTESVRQAVIAILMIVVGMALMNGQRLWEYNLKDEVSMRTRIMSPELVALLRSPFLQRQEGVNIRLRDMYETMVAPVVYDRQAELSVPHYFVLDQPNGQGYPFACTVMSKDQGWPAHLAGTKPLVETKHYMVLGTPECK